ncbi:hypothetical protein T10_1005 [Trichinella papuae]|uniref:Uncharacterized protein n=1 Tax=Trichinella papuae TaxID=268474 RepID=A0A0V1MDK3_9BILA|nr:hypothetical protein T10_1005 [Trichinella papuae]
MQWTSCTPIRAKFRSRADVRMESTATNTKDPLYGLPPPTQRVGRKMQLHSLKHVINYGQRSF